MASLKVLLLFLVFAIIALAVHAEDAEDAAQETVAEEADDEYEDYDDEDDGGASDHPLTDMPSESDEITVRYQFIDNKEGTDFALGDAIHVLVGVINTSPEDYNVTFAMGSVNHPVDMAFYIQNFTKMDFNTTLQPNTEYTFQYDFFPNPQNLDVDSKYQLSLSLFYENELEFFADTFFNQTVNFYEKDGDADFQTVFLYAVLAGLAFVGFYLLSNSCKKTSGPVEAGTSDRAITADDIGSVKSAHSDRAGNEKAGGLRRAKGKKNSTAKKKAKKALKARRAARRDAENDANKEKSE
jgi:hypothetical protein